MAELEQLEIIIDVIDQFEDELDRLLLKLAEVETAVQAVDDIHIDVEVRGERELDALIAKLGTLEGMDLSGVGDIVVGDKHIRRGGGGGRGGITGRQFDRLDDLMGVQQAQLGRLIKDMGELDIEASGASRSMRNAADAAEDATSSFFEADLRMTDVHNALARLVPMLLVFIGAIPAVVGALVALAAAAVAATVALAALTGFAALGAAAEMGGGDIGAGFEEMLQEIQEDFLDAFMPIAQRLAPLFQDAIDGLDRFFQAVANQGDSLVELSDDARAFGQFIQDAMPPFLNNMARFVDAMSGVFGLIANADVDIFGTLAMMLEESLGPMMVLTSQIASLLPHIFRLSVGFLQATNLILFFGNAVLDIVTIGGMLDHMLGLVVGSLLAAYGAALLLNSALIAMAGSALVSAGRSIIQLVAYLAGYLGASGSAIASTLGLAASFKVLAAAIALTGIGALVVILGGIAGSAAAASTNIDRATKSLKEFQRQQSRLSSGNNPYADPNVKTGEGTGRSRFSGGNQVNITVEGDADDETLRNQTQNALYRMERPQRGR